MTLLHRAATIVAMTVALATLGLSSQGRAQQIMPIVSAQVVDPATPSAQQADIDGDNIVTPPAVPAAPSSDDTFVSLAAAVAAHQDRATDDAARCLAGAIYFEAKGEPLSGQLGVAQVIINRAKSGRFPADVCAVVTQRGQFGFVRGGQIPAIDGSRAAYRTALAVARVALARAWDGPAPAALYFNTPGNPPGARLVRVASIGNHVFYR